MGRSIMPIRCGPVHETDRASVTCVPSACLLTRALLVFLMRSDQAQSQGQVDLEPVTAADAPDSADFEEYTLQMGGILAAFRERCVWDGIEASPPNGIVVTVVLWSSLDEQYAVEGWRGAQVAVTPSARRSAIISSVCVSVVGASGSTEGKLHVRL
jgi:hypothetical protein